MKLDKPKITGRNETLEVVLITGANKPGIEKNDMFNIFFDHGKKSIQVFLQAINDILYLVPLTLKVLLNFLSQ